MHVGILQYEKISYSNNFISYWSGNNFGNTYFDKYFDNGGKYS